MKHIALFKCIIYILLLFHTRAEGIYALGSDKLEFLIDYCNYDDVGKKDKWAEYESLYSLKLNNYEISNAFVISVPNTVELRSEYDIYTREISSLRWQGYKVNTNQVVFQQRGLSTVSSKSLNTYCRIMIDYKKGNIGDYYRANEYEPLGAEDVRYLRSVAIQSCTSIGFRVIGTPKVRWVKIGDIYSMELSYMRTGTEGNTTKVYTYLFFNKDETVTITLSYWVRDEKQWKDDLMDVVQSFQWNRIKL